MSLVEWFVATLRLWWYGLTHFWYVWATVLGLPIVAIVLSTLIERKRKP